MMPVFKIVYIPDRIRYGLCWGPHSAEIGVYGYPRIAGGREEDLAMYPYQNNGKTKYPNSHPRLWYPVLYLYIYMCQQPKPQHLH